MHLGPLFNASSHNQGHLIALSTSTTICMHALLELIVDVYIDFVETVLYEISRQFTHSLPMSTR